MSVSLVARQEGLAASLLFLWRKLERQGALTAVSSGEAAVPACELAAARAEIAKLQRVLVKKTLENEILKEAVQDAAEKSGLRARTSATCAAALRRGLTGAPGPRLSMLESIRTYWLSASCASTSKTRCQTPHLLQREWRRCTT